MIVLDTSFLVSFFRSGDSNHAKAVELFQKHRSDEMLLMDEILFETLSVLNSRDGVELARLAHRELSANSRLLLVYLNAGERKEILDEFLAQAGGLSVADISVVHACRKTFSAPLAFDKGIIKAIGK